MTRGRMPAAIGRFIGHSHVDTDDIFTGFSAAHAGRVELHDYASLIADYDGDDEYIYIMQCPLAELLYQCRDRRYIGRCNVDHFMLLYF